MNIFDNIKRTDPEGHEYWNSRELAKALDYTDYRNFEDIITKAKTACKNSLQAEEHHFVDVTEMIELAKGAQRQITSVFLYG
jgi:DNA-damage-inducible protein D